MRILFADGTKGYSPDRLKAQPTGGIATSLTIIPRYLAAKGHEVYVKSLYDSDGVVEGVNFLKKSASSPPVDVVVLNRNMLRRDSVAAINARGARVIWWLHDIVDHRYLQDDSFKGIQHIVSLSDYCTRTYSDFYDLPRDRFTVIPNGVDRSVWYPGDYTNRDPRLFVYASAPVKGYAPLAFTMHNLARKVKGLDFRIYSSQGLHDLEDRPITKAWLHDMAGMGANVSNPIPQRDLADVFRKAWVLLMPNDYPEICSNLILQAQACGLPVVTSPIGSASEFIEHGKTGLLTTYFPHDKYMWWVDFTRQVMSLVEDKSLHRKVSEESVDRPVTWDEVCGKWEEYVESVVGKADRLIGLCKVS